MRSDIKFISFLILSFLLSFQLLSKEVRFSGFRLQPEPDIQKYPDLLTLKKDLLATGFFKQVTLTEKSDHFLILVTEYPKVSTIKFIGLSLFDSKYLATQLEIIPGRQFNSFKFTQALKRFYSECREKGFSHFTVSAVKVEQDGAVLAEIQEGILKAVRVKDDLISATVINRFFGRLINKPFNTRKFKLQLEELLYTEAFFSIASNVRHESGQVLVELVPDKKQLNLLDAALEYSAYSGLKVRSSSSWLTRSNNIGFWDYDFRYLSSGDDMLAALSLTHYGYQRNLAASHFKLTTSLSYLDFNSENGLLLDIIPRYNLSLAKLFFASAFVRAGFVKGFAGLPNNLFCGFGLGLSFDYRSPLQSFIFTSSAWYYSSLLYSYQTLGFSSFLKKDFSWFEFKAAARINQLKGGGIIF